MKKYTSIQIAKAIRRAEQLGNDRAIKVMADMKTQLDKRGCLSDRQWDYLSKLMVENCKAAVVDFEQYTECFATDDRYRKKIEVVANYYINSDGQYFTRTAIQALRAVKHHGKGDYELPNFLSLSKMLNNPYADKVWSSHINPPLYAAGDLVKIRSTGVNRIWSQRLHFQEKQAGIENLNSHICFITKVNAQPITHALSYKPKLGGARVYSVMPIGTTMIYYILECDLKKNRTSKTKK